MVRKVGRELKAYKDKKGTVLQLKKKRAEAKMYNEVTPNSQTCWVLLQVTPPEVSGDLVDPPRLLPFEALRLSPILCLRSARVSFQKGRSRTLPRFNHGTASSINDIV